MSAKSIGGDAPPTAPSTWQRTESAGGPDPSRAAVIASGEIHLGGHLRAIEWRHARPSSQALLQALGGNSAAGRSAAARQTPASLGLQGIAPIEASIQVDPKDWAGVTEGVDFLSQLQCSAACGGQTFRAVAAELRLDPAARSEVAASLDAHMQQWFEQERGKRDGPIPPEQAHEEVRSTLASTFKSH